MTVIAMAVSGGLAGLAGIVLALQQQESMTGNGVVYTVTGIAVALVGGTSAFGRRGGVFGTVLAASLYALLAFYVFQVRRWSVDQFAFAGGALLIGLVVTRLVESHGRPRRGAEVEEDGSDWLGQQQGGWADQLPARATEVDFDAADERWGRIPPR